MEETITMFGPSTLLPGAIKEEREMLRRINIFILWKLEGISRKVLNMCSGDAALKGWERKEGTASLL